MSLHHGAMDWSVVCDCGISLSYSLIVVIILNLCVLKFDECYVSSHFHIFALWVFYISTSSQFECELRVENLINYYNVKVAHHCGSLTLPRLYIVESQKHLNLECGSYVEKLGRSHLYIVEFLYIDVVYE